MASSGAGRRKARTVRWFALAFAVLAVATSLLVQAGSALIVRRPLRDADVIIGLASHEWHRLPLVAELAARYPAATVLLTKPQEVTPYNCHDCANRVAWLRTLGVEEGRVHTVALNGPGTYAEAVAALAFMRSAGGRRLVIATSPYHTRRSLALFCTVFEGSGVEIGIEPAGTSPPVQPSRWFLAPDDRAYVPYEWAAIAYYAMKYGVPIGRVCGAD